MILRRAILPVLLIAGLAFVLADGAEAAGITALAPAPLTHPGGVHVGIGVGIAGPIGPRVRHPGARYRVRPAGQWVIREEQIWVPGDLVGYDAYGHPIYTEGYWTLQRTRVWVPAPRVYPHPRPYSARPYSARPYPATGYVRLGAVFH